VGLKLNGTHRFLAYAEVGLLGDNILVHTIKKDTETLIDASKETGLEMKAEKNYVAVSSPECSAKS
jgi:hypothetical protein